MWMDPDPAIQSEVRKKKAGMCINAYRWKLEKWYG